MLPIIPKPPISRAQKSAAIAIAGCADLIQLGLAPFFFEGAMSPFEDVLDFFVALLLMMVCGFRWQFVLAFAMELIPGLDLLPTWTAVVLLIPSGSPEVGFEVMPNEASSEYGGAPPVQPPALPPRITVTAVPPRIAPPVTREP